MRAAVDWLRRHLFSRENLWALVLCILFLVLLIMSADQSPLWIYQGF